MEPRGAKERLLSQRGVTLWFTGLSGSGKSTVAVALERRLSAQGHLCRILDGDNVRCGINSDLGIFFDAGDENAVGIKGLYAKARRGDIADFTGISAPFEAPEAPDIEIDTTNAAVDECVRRIMEKLTPRIAFAAEND